MTSVLITGANKGLGHETARRLGELGWKVFLGSRDEDRGRGAAEKLAADGADVVMVPLDVSSEESLPGNCAVSRRWARRRAQPAAAVRERRRGGPRVPWRGPGRPRRRPGRRRSAHRGLASGARAQA
jgi:nucleoside-diphosphate-sugar epimerase